MRAIIERAVSSAINHAYFNMLFIISNDFLDFGPKLSLQLLNLKASLGFDYVDLVPLDYRSYPICRN